MDKTYYKDYFHLERNHWFFLGRAKIIMGFLNKISNSKKNLKILNVGVATGRTSELLEELGQVKSVEFDIDCYEFVKETLDIDIIQGSILELPFKDNSFDLVCAFDVIEHVEDDQTAMNELLRVCKSAGNVCITVPAFMFLWSDHDVINHHFRRYTEKQLTKLVPSKQKIIFTSYFNFFLFPIILLIRFISNLFKSKNKPVESSFAIGPKNKFLDKILFTIFQSEIFFINRNFRLPFGVSIITGIQKT